MISLVRVDDRLIHGQVVTQWISYNHINIIYIVDDILANDSFMKNMLVNMAPDGTKVKVVTVDAACENMNKIVENNDLSAMIITNTPMPIQRMIDANIKITDVVLGGMGARADRKRIFKTVAISEEEKNSIQYLIDKGLKVVCHIVPYTNPVEASEALKSYDD